MREAPSMLNDRLESFPEKVLKKKLLFLILEKKKAYMGANLKCDSTSVHICL
jgi:hypothetical protein